MLDKKEIAERLVEKGAIAESSRNERPVWAAQSCEVSDRLEDSGGTMWLGEHQRPARSRLLDPSKLRSVPQ
jgi:hypothetical protein